MPNGVSVRWIISIREHQNWTIVSIQFSKVTLEGLWKSRLIDQAVVLCALVLALQHALEQIHVYDCDQELPTTPLTYLYVDAPLACVVATGGVRYVHNTRSLNCPYIVQQAESISACVEHSFSFHAGLPMRGS
jgi:hypothetical protein